jgi:hypothetical protein
MKKEHRIPQFYGMPKVHKDKFPIPLRPVISQCGSFSAIISTFLDYKLQPFTSRIPSYIQNSTSLLNKLDILDTLPKSARLFTSDATSMYTNIDPVEGISTIKKYLIEYNKEIRDLVSIPFICDLLKLVMENNVFQFESTWWKQKVGTAMGTPCACIYATMFFAWFERQKIMTKYKNNFILYCRQIDDIFGIWIDDSRFPNRWNEFKNDLNSYCKLDWNTEELSHSVNFLDLTIEINKTTGKIQYKTFQKPMNLFLYIPGHSAHPPGIIKSLIFGLVHTYFRQNSQREDFTRNVKLLFGRLLVRGHLHNDIHPIFVQAAQAIDNNIQKQQQRKRYRNPTGINMIQKRTNKSLLPTDNDLYFHIPYHPRDLSRRAIQQSYHETCEAYDALGENFKSLTNWEGKTMEINKLTVAYSRGKNLRDFLVKSTLQEFEGCKVSNFL